AKQLGVRVEIDQETAAKLDEGDEAADDRSAPRAGSAGQPPDHPVVRGSGAQPPASSAATRPGGGP
ncbi:MAG TPA: hypothetical protein VLM79_32370, partial [Kofleriaceae bacterium]|nr:hypothetical protein [Kofleriaceae bacterium]